jgi:hypothetical protein
MSDGAVGPRITAFHHRWNWRSWCRERRTPSLPIRCAMLKPLQSKCRSRSWRGTRRHRRSDSTAAASTGLGKVPVRGVPRGARRTSPWCPEIQYRIPRSGVSTGMAITVRLSASAWISDPWFSKVESSRKTPTRLGQVRSANEAGSGLALRIRWWGGVPGRASRGSNRAPHRRARALQPACSGRSLLRSPREMASPGPEQPAEVTPDSRPASSTTPRWRGMRAALRGPLGGEGRSRCCQSRWCRCASPRRPANELEGAPVSVVCHVRGLSACRVRSGLYPRNPRFD